MTEQQAADYARTVQRTVAGQSQKTADAVTNLYRRIVTDRDPWASRAQFVERALPIVKAGERNASALMLSGYKRMRTMSGVKGSMPSAPVELHPDEQIASSLTYTGFVAPERAQVETDAAKAVGGSVTRFVTQSAMNRAIALSTADRAAIGYARVTTSAEPCYFCTMLVSRGAVYSDDSFAYSDRQFKDNAFPPDVLSGEAVAKVHDSCRCVLVPIYSPTSPILTQADELYDTWLDVQGRYLKFTGGDMIRAWRMFWEDRVPPEWG